MGFNKDIYLKGQTFSLLRRLFFYHEFVENLNKLSKYGLHFKNIILNLSYENVTLCKAYSKAVMQKTYDKSYLRFHQENKPIL